MAAIVAAGCAASVSTNSAAPYTPSRLSRDGVIQYHPLTGWLDVTADSSGSDRTVWLVRDDYAGSLSMREIHVDPTVRRNLGIANLVDVARLAAALEIGSRRGFLARDPEPMRENGKDVVAFEVDYRESGDKMRAVVLSTGEHVYQICVLVNGTALPTVTNEIFGALDTFVGDLRW